MTNCSYWRVVTDIPFLRGLLSVGKKIKNRGHLLDGSIRKNAILYTPTITTIIVNLKSRRWPSLYIHTMCMQETWRKSLCTEKVWRWQATTTSRCEMHTKVTHKKENNKKLPVFFQNNVNLQQTFLSSDLGIQFCFRFTPPPRYLLIVFFSFMIIMDTFFLLLLLFLFFYFLIAVLNYQFCSTISIIIFDISMNERTLTNDIN